MQDLDLQQNAAVDAGPVDLFIEAGAGSGKTRVLSARFVSAVLGENGYTRSDPRDLLAVTYTDKAAGELVERIRTGLSAAGDAAGARAMGEAWISTIHGMCSRILRQHALEAGLDPRFRVLDEVESGVLEAEAIELAVADLLDADLGAEALFDAFGYAKVVREASRAREVVRSLGVGPDAIGTVGQEEAAVRLRSLARELESLAAGFATLRTTSTVENNRAAVASAVAELNTLLGARNIDPAVVMRCIDGCSMRKLASVEGHNELVEAVREALAEAGTSAAQLAVGAYESAFASLVDRLERAYAALKAARGALDFEDLQVLTARLLEDQPGIAAEYRSRFSMLMLDESQDTNALQMRIMQLLAADNLCTVGDQNQSIYSFRHADVGVFRDRAERAGRRLRLDTNYRIAPTLLAALNGLFSHPALIGPGFMRLAAPDSARDEPEWLSSEDDRLKIRFVDDSEPMGRDMDEVEASCVADSVQELVDRGVPPRDIAVLMRALAGGRAVKVERELIRRGIPVHLADGGAFFECREIVEARALLEVIDNVRNDVALATTLSGRLVGIGADSLVALRLRASEIAAQRGVAPSEMHLSDALDDHHTLFPSHESMAVQALLDAVAEARRQRGVRPLRETVLQPLLELDADLVTFASGRGGARAWSNLEKLGRMAAEYESAEGGDLRGFLTYLESRETYARAEQEAVLDAGQDAVRIMTIHAAKGLEFPAVVLAGLKGSHSAPAIAVARVQGAVTLGMRLPGEEASRPTLGWERVVAQLESVEREERARLLYVGCTRAQEALTVIVRTHPGKDADESLPGLVRRACGVGPADSIGDPARATTLGAHALERWDPPSDSAREDTGDFRASRTRTDANPGGKAVRTADDVIAGGRQAPRAPAQIADVPPQVSYTALSTYSKCPYRFYLTSIARLPAPPAMQEGGALALGKAVHLVLERCEGPKGDAEGLLAAAAASAGLRPQSIPRLREAVRSYLSSPLAARVYACARAMREVPLIVPIAGTVLAGAIDVIAWEGSRALIVDFKTGDRPLSEAEARRQHRLQGECYALAALAAGAEEAEVVFVELERGREVSYRYTAGELGEVESRVASIIARMRSDGYPPKDAYDESTCETCPGLGGMCAIRRPQRPVVE